MHKIRQRIAEERRDGYARAGTGLFAAAFGCFVLSLWSLLTERSSPGDLIETRDFLVWAALFLALWGAAMHAVSYVRRRRERRERRALYREAAERRRRGRPRRGSPQETMLRL